MEFGVDRASDRRNKPCNEAYKKKYDYVQTKYGIDRTFPNDCEGWFIKINTLKELLEFEKEYGDLVIGRNWRNHHIMQITIYDGYIE